MRAALLLAGLLSFPLTLAACSEKTQDKAEQTVNAANRDAQAAVDRAGVAAARATGELSAATARAAAKLDKGADDLGNALDTAADKGRAKTGAALERAGKAIKD